jgi:hypothetical protein
MISLSTLLAGASADWVGALMMTPAPASDGQMLRVKTHCLL